MLQLAQPTNRRRSWPGRPAAWQAPARTAPPCATATIVPPVLGRQPVERRHHPQVHLVVGLAARPAALSGHPALVPVRVGIAGLLARQAAPRADVDLPQPGLQRHLEPGGVGDRLRRLVPPEAGRW